MNSKLQPPRARSVSSQSMVLREPCHFGDSTGVVSLTPCHEPVADNDNGLVASPTHSITERHPGFNRASALNAAGKREVGRAREEGTRRPPSRIAVQHGKIYPPQYNFARLLLVDLWLNLSSCSTAIAFSESFKRQPICRHRSASMKAIVKEKKIDAEHRSFNKPSFHLCA